MSLKIDKRDPLRIFDRTLINLDKRRFLRLDLIYLCWLLKEIGVDTIEIDKASYNLISKLPTGINFSLYIQDEDDFFINDFSEIRHIIINEELLNVNETNEFIKLHFKDKKISVNIMKSNYKSLFELEKRIIELSNEDFYSIRLTGLDKFQDIAFSKCLISFFNDNKKRLDLCPSNEFHFATAISVDSCINNVNILTTSFLGMGNLTPLEELLISIKVIMDSKVKIDLKSIPEICRLLKRDFNIEISDSKPVVGKNIFKYESGIHADGIEKNSNTYEPYDPTEIGQRRSLSIGKHSGKNSILSKLKSLGLKVEKDCLQLILNCVRDKSIELKRELTDNEFRSIYESI